MLGLRRAHAAAQNRAPAVTITLEGRVPCVLCGCQIRVLAFPSVVVNKRSIRQQPGNYMCWGAGCCPECGTDNQQATGSVRYRLTADSLAEVEAYRAQRWPELAVA